MDTIEIFKKMRDVCDCVVKALEAEDVEATEAALGKFMLLMVQLDALK
jgi:uncharacterized MnhB-related membrane protein